MTDLDDAAIAGAIADSAAAVENASAAITIARGKALRDKGLRLTAAVNLPQDDLLSIDESANKSADLKRP